jgi:tRNA G18 (ribose-2'-O)-methylase SpoU
MRKVKNEALDRLGIEEFKNAKKLPVCIVLDNIRSMINVGAAFRTADAFRIEKIYLTGITAQPPHREINKTALGATESVDWEYAENTYPLLASLKDQGTRILAIEQIAPSTSLREFHPENGKSYALVFGNEVFGVSEEILPLIDRAIEIPQYGTKHSLNISVSVGVVVWDFFSKLNPGF